jgi:hypothetical protein
MSWNLLIYKEGATSEGGGPLGALEAVRAVLDRAFPGLEWQSPVEATLPVDGGFSLEVRAEDDMVQDIYTHGGYDHLKEFAAMCRQESWRIADAQEGEDVDLDDPYKWYEERGG